MGGAKNQHFDDTDENWHACQGGCGKRYPEIQMYQVGMGPDAPWSCKTCDWRDPEDAREDQPEHSTPKADSTG